MTIAVGDRVIIGTGLEPLTGRVTNQDKNCPFGHDTITIRLDTWCGGGIISTHKDSVKKENY